jgi:hypothetical protein
VTEVFAKAPPQLRTADKLTAKEAWNFLTNIT